MTEDATIARRTGVSTAPRTAAMWAAVDEVVRARSAELGRPLRVIDLGGGTGGLAVPLAVAGHDVTVVDPSPDALASLRRRAAEAQASSRGRGVPGDAEPLASLVGRDLPDLVLCHATLEYVDDPAATLALLAGVLAPGGILSLVVPQRSAAVIARAIAGPFAQARAALDRPDGRWGDADPVPRRFDRTAVLGLVEAAGFTTTAAHGIRIFSDLVPSALVDSDADRSALLDLERAVVAHPEFSVLADLGTSLHVIAART